MKDTTTIIIILLILVLLCVYITSKIETFYNEEVNAGVKKMKNNTNTDLSEQDKFIECPNGANFKQIADAYVQCCKLDSNKALCEHPTFKKCKEDYLKVATDKDYIKYLGNEDIYNMAKLQFGECIKTMNNSLSNYGDVSYTDVGSTKNMVVDLYPLSGKSNMQETCKNMCNIWKDQCKGYSSDDSNCMLYSSVNKFDPVNNEGRLFRGNNLKKKD
jgi:hypothetical protein